MTDLNEHGTIKQNHDSTNSEVLVVMAQSEFANSDIRCSISWDEYD